MQNIFFEKLKAKNFRCHNEIEFDFPANKLIAIVGKNGAGKTSIPMALRTVIYGNPGSRLTISDVVNEKVGKNMELELDFRIEDDVTKTIDKYEIKRYYKHSKHGGSLILNKNNENISGTTTDDTYKIIESILWPEDVFINTIYFQQEVKDFFTALTDSEQKKIFNAILDLSEFADYYEICDKELTKFENKISEIQTEIVKLNSILPEKKDQLEMTIIHFEERKKKLVEDIKNIDDEIETIFKVIKDRKRKRETIVFDENKYNAIVKKINIIDDSLNKFDEDLDRKKREIERSINVEKEKEESNSKNELLREKGKIESEFSKFKSEKEKEKSDVQIEINKLLEEKTNSINKIHEKFAKKIDKLNSSINDINEKISNLKNDQVLSNYKFDSKNKINEIECKSHKLILKNDSITLNIESLQNETKKINSSIQDLQDAKKKNVIICPTCKQEVKNTKHIDKEISDKKEQLDQNESLVIVGNQDILNNKEIIDNNKLKIEKINKEYEEKIENRTNENNAKISKYDKEVNEYTESLSKIEETKSIEIKSEEDSTNNKTEKFNQRIEGFNQEIIEKKNNIVSIFNEKKDEIKKTLDTLLCNLEQNKGVQLTSLIQEFDTKKINLQKDLSNLKTEKDYLQEIKEKISLINTQIICDENIIISKKEQKKKLEETKIDESQILIIENDIKLLQGVIVEKEQEQVKLNKIIKIITFWKEGCSNRGIPSMLIDNSIPFMNEYVRNELDKVSPGKFTVSFDTVGQTKAGDVREKFTVNVVNNLNGASKHKALSGGEKRLIDVCCMKSLRALDENLRQKRVNVTLMDEVLDSLDDDNSATFCYYLKKLAQKECIVLITHSSSKVSEADEVLRM
jgi:DNA repair exonuclease SbcCD ATPase subunit